MQEKPKVVLDKKTKRVLDETKEKATIVVNKFPQNHIRGQYGIKIGPGAEPSDQVFKTIQELTWDDANVE